MFPGRYGTSDLILSLLRSHYLLIKCRLKGVPLNTISATQFRLATAMSTIQPLEFRWGIISTGRIAECFAKVFLLYTAPVGLLTKAHPGCLNRSKDVSNISVHITFLNLYFNTSLALIHQTRCARCCTQSRRSRLSCPR